MPKAKTVTAYKAFNADMTCHGFPYKVGKTYEYNGKVELCNSGFHACLDPFDVWNYYGAVDTRYAVVEVWDHVSGGDDSKIASAKITIKSELSLPDFIRDAVSKLIASTSSKKTAASGDWSQLAASGDGSKLAASGNGSQLAASGNGSKLAASGNNCVVASSAINATAKGADGTWISLAEFNDKNECIGFAVGKIGTKGLKPDTWYLAKGGKLVKA